MDVAALAEIAAVPFLDNELFVLIRALQRLLQCSAKEEDEGAGVGVGGGATSGNVCEDPEACLESVLTSQSFRVLAEQRIERGLDGEAAGLLEEAIGQMKAFVEEGHRLPRPSRCAIATTTKRSRQRTSTIIFSVILMVLPKGQRTNTLKKVHFGNIKY